MKCIEVKVPLYSELDSVATALLVDCIKSGNFPAPADVCETDLQFLTKCIISQASVRIADYSAQLVESTKNGTILSEEVTVAATAYVKLVERLSTGDKTPTTNIRRA